ncbi:MAG: GDP-mannose 4,6-dehydratase [Candidatus Altiarchaeota archaeon]|nr:GDP-mannose 4,6-dehydratase [Candidatus Altiarchaeota archaeon]
MTKDEYWNRKNVFVTGATGILGSWLVEELLSQKAHVIALIRDWVPDSNLYLSGLDKKVTIVHGCLEDYQVVERSLNEYEVDTVFHLGAQTIVGTANRSPLSTFESNIKGTWNVLEAVRNSKLVQRLVVASSDKAYGPSDSLPYTEETPLAAIHPYDVSKSCSDLLARSYYETYGIPVGITRCGNFYGGGDLNFNRIVPGTIRSIYFKESPVIRSDGKYVRDYFYVKDAVDAYLTLGRNLDRREVRGHAFNFGTEEKISVIDLVNKILKICKAENLKPRVLNEATNEIREQYLSCKKAKSMLSWDYSYPLDKGLKETVDWYFNFFKNH